MQIDIQFPEVSELADKIERLSKALRNPIIGDIFTEILDSKEAARYLKISWRYLQVLKEKKEIPYSQHGTIVRYRKSDLDKWMDEHRVSAGTTN